MRILENLIYQIRLLKEIHNGVPYEEFKEVKFSKKTSTTFLFLNAFRRELRNLDLLLKAFALLKREFQKTHLILVGSSLGVNFLPQRAKMRKLLSLVSQLGIDKDVEVHPFSSNPWKNIKDVLAFILPADQVWLNNALLEAMS